MERLRRDRDRWRLGGREHRRPLPECGASDRGGRSRAGRRRVLVLGVHAEQGAAAPGRGARRGAPGARGRGRGDRRARRRRGAGAARRHRRPLGRRRPGGVARGRGRRRSSAAAAGWPGERRVDVELPDGADARARGPTRRSCSPPASSAGDPPDRRPARRAAVGQPRRHQRARRCPSGLLVLGGGVVGVRDGAGVEAAGRARGDDRRRGATRCSHASEPFAGDELREAFEAEGITVVPRRVGRPRVRRRRRRRRRGHAHAGRRSHVRPATSCSSPPVADPTPTTSGSTRSASSPAKPVEVDDQLRATGVDGRLALRGRRRATAARCSPTWASTRRGSRPT